MSGNAPAPTKGPEPTPSSQKLADPEPATPTPGDSGDPTHAAAQDPQPGKAAPGDPNGGAPDKPDIDKPEVDGGDSPAGDNVDAAQPLETPGAGEGEEVAVSSVDELIETQDWDPDWFGDLKLKVKVDGEETETTIKDLVAGHQMGAAAEKRLTEAKEKHKAATQQIAERTQAAEQQFVVASGLVQQLEEQLVADTNAIDWKKLREEDSGEFAAKKQEVADRRAKIEQAKAELAEQYTAAVEEQRQQLAADHKTRVEENFQQLLEQVPAWADEKAREKGKAELSSYLQTQGFSKEEAEGNADHRLIVLALKAKELDDGKAQIDTASKKVRKTPKVIPPGNKAAAPAAPKPTDRAGILYPSS